MISGHGGNVYELARRLGCDPADITDMSSNINPLGPPPGLMDYLKSNIALATRLPEVDSGEITARYAEFLEIDPNRLLAGNGTTQFIYSLPGVLESRRALVAGPAYADYADACKLARVPTFMLIASEADDFHPDLERLESSLAGIDTVFLCNPNNPTGVVIPGAELKDLCRCNPETRFIIDESYLPFVDFKGTESLIRTELENVIVLLSISKIFAIPGLRIGFILGSAATIEKFRRQLWPWSVNCFAHAAVRYLATHKSSIEGFIDRTIRHIESEREVFERTLEQSGRIKLYPSSTPFFLARLPRAVSSESTREYLSRKKILIRNCSNFPGLSDQFIRISLKAQAANRVLAEELNGLVRYSNKSPLSYEWQTLAKGQPV
jgi:threonine-phosphate decarboxylase